MDLDQMSHFVASDLSAVFATFPIVEQVVKYNCSNFRTSMVNVQKFEHFIPYIFWA